MTLHHLPVPDPADTPQEPARPGFAALLRSGLPTGLLDFLPFAVIAVVLRIFARVSWPASVAAAALLIPVVVVGFAAAEYLAVRFLPRRSADDDGESGDG